MWCRLVTYPPEFWGKETLEVHRVVGTEVICVDLGYWAISGLIHPKHKCSGWDLLLGVEGHVDVGQVELAASHWPEHPANRYSSQFENNHLTEMCSSSEAGSYSRLIDFVYHSTLGLRAIKKKKKNTLPASHLHFKDNVLSCRLDD